MEMINDTIRTKAVELTENQSVLFADDNFILHKLSSFSVAKAAPMWKIEEAANGETTLGSEREPSHRRANSAARREPRRPGEPSVASVSGIALIVQTDSGNGQESQKRLTVEGIALIAQTDGVDSGDKLGL